MNIKTKVKTEVKDCFLSKELASLAGLSNYMVTYLVRAGLLSASVSVGAHPSLTRPQYGNARLFSFSDLLLARSLGKLLAAGVSVKALRASIDVLQTKLGRAFVTTPVTIVGKQIYILDDNIPSPTELTRGGQLAFSFVLEVDQLRDAASQIVLKRSKADTRRVHRHSSPLPRPNRIPRSKRRA